MNNIDNEIFDERIRKMAKDEIDTIPDNIDNLFINTSKNLKHKRFRFQKVCSITALLCITSILFGMAMPYSYIENIPVYSDVVDACNKTLYEHYDGYASDLNVTKESNGTKFTVNKVIYDDYTLAIVFTIETEEKLPGIPGFHADTRINGSKIELNESIRGDFTDDTHTKFLGSVQYNFSLNKFIPKEIQAKNSSNGYVDIPSKFKLDFRLDSIDFYDVNSIEGNWNFVIPVNSSNMNKQINRINYDYQTHLYDNNVINNIIVTPINTIIQSTEDDSSDDRVLDRVRYFIYDNNGMYLVPKGAQGEGSGDLMYNSDAYKEISEDTKSLTFIPYAIELHNWANEPISFDLNLNGDTKLYCINGDEYGKITKVEIKDGKTKLYCKSKYFINRNLIEIRDKDDNIVCKTMRYREDHLYLPETNEYVLSLDGELNKDENYKITILDNSGMGQILDDKKFTIDIK